MEVERLFYGSGGAPAVEAFNLMVHTVVAAEKSIYWLLFLVGSIPNTAVALRDLLEAENRFPFSDLNKVSSPDAECKDSGEQDDDSDDDDPDASDDSDDDMEDSSGEDDDDDDEQGDADSESDTSDDEDEDDDDDDDDEDDDEEDDEDEEEDNQPPFKKTK
ncbi:hypothetical protein SSX86_010211 [Deinandra increscens subsp. villosa]|uniref:Uncharacterized protein n=1 Tax=Deinandra increscens subsp. villosa TaxID=3103831 RepID=A0AAP0DBE7_9ASTR